jgi:tripartite-type tricarboxylate transporter receptor subunit TctC
MRLLVGFAPGGGNDIAARLIAHWLSERLGQQFIVENRPGAGSNIATEAVVRAPADGYTLLLVAVANATMQRFTTTSISTSFATLRQVFANSISC